MNRKQVLALALLGALLVAFCSWFIATRDRNCVVSFELRNQVRPLDEYIVQAEPEGFVEITDVRLEGRNLNVTISPLKSGHPLLFATSKDGSYSEGHAVYVHKSGIITQDIFFGPFNGDRIVPIVMLYLNNNL